MRAVCCILIALFVGASTAASLDANPCSWCNCTKGDKDENITVVVCTCHGEERKSLVLEQENMQNLTDVQNMTVISCSSVELKPKTFSKQLKLNTLIIDAAENVVIASEVFSTLSELVISDVKNLKLDEKSLQNVTKLSNIVIKKTGISELPQGAINNLPGLAKLKLDRVKLGEVKNGAIQLSMNKAASVLIEHCEIGHIQEAGIVCSSINEFTLINSTLKSGAKNSTNIVAHTAVKITGNTLQPKVASDSFNIASKSVSVTGNTFTHFPAGLLRETGATVSFSDNIVLEPNWDLILKTSLVNITFINNIFSCKCSSKEKLTSKNDTTESESWLDKNYCLAICNLTLKRLPEACQKVSGKDDEICKKIDDRKTALNFTLFPNPPTGTPTTSAPSTTSKPTKSPNNGCQTILTSSLLSIALSSLIFTIL